jgi:uncharacterized membrane protein
MSGALSIEPRRLALLAALLAILGAIQMLQPDSFSPLSFLLLVAVHLPYAFGMKADGDGGRIIKFFLGIVTLLALCGIAQYGLQFLVNARYLFPIENFVPNTFIVQHFNHQAAMEYGSQEFRANGVLHPGENQPACHLRDRADRVLFRHRNHRARGLPALVHDRATPLGNDAARYLCVGSGDRAA